MKTIKYFIPILMAFILAKSANAGEVMKKGTVLPEESYVFTIDEAKKLMKQIENLEIDNKNQKKIIKQYKNLDQVQKNKIKEFDSLLSIKDLQISEYKKLHELDVNQVERLERQVKFTKIEKWAYIGIGAGVVVGSILIADKIDDSLENPIYVNNPNTSARSKPLVRF